MDPVPDDRANGHAPSRDPAVAAALARALEELRSAESDYEKFLAVANGVAALDGYESIAAIQRLGQEAIAAGLDADSIRIAIENGKKRTEEARQYRAMSDTSRQTHPQR